MGSSTSLDIQRYFKVLLVGLAVFGLSYTYIWLQKIPNPLNKSVADTAVVLMGFSMMISSICYFFNLFDFLIVYRKHFGLIGFSFGLVHIVLSYPALQQLFLASTWQEGEYWPPLTGLIAAIIFTIMAIISNSVFAKIVGGIVWRKILRTGYIAMMFVMAHIILLRSDRWVVWFQEGHNTLPSTSMIISALILFVLVLRLILWLALKKQKINSMSR